MKHNREINFRKPTATEVKDFLLDNLIWLIGGATYASAINMFAVPNQIALSGITGLSIVINYLTELPTGITNFLLNVPLLLLAWFFIGHKFVFRTLWVTVIISSTLDLLIPYLPTYTGDRLLASIFCGIMSGAGLALVMVRGATSGGTDIVGRLVRTKWPHISMGTVIMIADTCVVIISAIVFRSIESAMYAAIVIFLSTRVLDYILYGTANGKMLMIVTDKAHEVAAAITSHSVRGVSIVPVTGGYTGEKKDMLIIAVRSSEVSHINKIVRQIDPNTFTIITEAGEILGKGFKLDDGSETSM